MIRLSCSLLMACATAVSLAAAEVQRFTELDLKQAEVLAEEGDLHSAVTSWLKILRRAEEKDLRSEAREHLERLGLSKQEIFQLDPGALKPEEWDKLLSRLAAAVAQRQRQEADFDYARGVLQLAVSPRLDAAGKARIDVQPKELSRALDLMLQVALSETNGEHVREAQSELEQLGVTGAQVGAVRKAAAEGKLPPEIQNELVCSVCLHRLHRYREWLEERVENDEQPVRKQLAQRLGLALYKCLAAQYAQTAVYKRPSDDLDFWRDIAHGGDPKTF